MSDPVKICNLASMMLGAEPIQSLEDDTDASRIFANTYDMAKKSIMSRYPWNFLKQTYELTRLAASPVQRWRYAYIIPGEALSGYPHAVFHLQGQKLGTNQFEVSRGRVLCNFPQVWADLIVDRRESEWPAYFQKLMAHAIAADVGLAITDQQSITDYHRAMAFGTPSEGGIGGLMGEAMTLDAQSEGGTGIASDYFVDARRGAWGGYGIGVR